MCKMQGSLAMLQVLIEVQHSGSVAGHCEPRIELFILLCYIMAAHHRLQLEEHNPAAATRSVVHMFGAFFNARSPRLLAETRTPYEIIRDHTRSYRTSASRAPALVCPSKTIPDHTKCPLCLRRRCPFSTPVYPSPLLFVPYSSSIALSPASQRLSPSAQCERAHVSKILRG